MAYWSVKLLLLVGPLMTCDAFTCDQMDQIKEAWKNWLSESTDDAGNFVLAHKAVRLSFHDCVGNCDGCLNTNNADNAGLANTVQTLERFYNEPGVVDGGSIKDLPDFSTADLWALAGGTALEFLSTCPKRKRPCSTGFEVPFQYGRKDCNSPIAPLTTDQHTFPSAHGDYDATINFFRDEFGFTERESIAILGAHTIGKASRSNSGFKGPWVSKRNEVNNDYYLDLLDSGLNWKQKNISESRNSRKNPPEPRWQWNSKEGKMMLNVDMCLAKDIKVDALGESSCDYGSCGPSDGASIVQEYADDNDKWLKEFIPAFVKMVGNTCGVPLSDCDVITAKKELMKEAEEALLVKLLIKDLQEKHN